MCGVQSCLFHLQLIFRQGSAFKNAAMLRRLNLYFSLIQPVLLMANDRQNSLFHFIQTRIHVRISNDAVDDIFFAPCVILIGHREFRDVSKFVL